MTDTLGSISSHYAIPLDCADANGIKVDTQASKDVTNIWPWHLQWISDKESIIL